MITTWLMMIIVNNVKRWDWIITPRLRQGEAVNHKVAPWQKYHKVAACDKNTGKHRISSEIIPLSVYPAFWIRYIRSFFKVWWKAMIFDIFEDGRWWIIAYLLYLRWMVDNRREPKLCCQSQGVTGYNTITLLFLWEHSDIYHDIVLYHILLI